MAAALDEPLITIKGTTHSHGPAGEHSHDGVDGHTWVDPLNAAEQAAMLAERMAEAWPEHAVAMRKNAAGLEADLRALHARLQEIDVSGVTLLASHPAYNYLARRLGWVVTGFDLDPQAAIDGETSSDLMAKLVEVDAGDRPVVMLWESSPADAAITRLRQMGIASVLFNPAETAGSSDGDYLAVMSANIDRLADAVR
jgi:zinc transport system substrate-binding protein